VSSHLASAGAGPERYAAVVKPPGRGKRETAVTSRYPRGKESAERAHRIVDYLIRRGHDRS